MNVSQLNDENDEHDEDALIARIKQHEVTALVEYLNLIRKPLVAFIERQLGPGLRRRIEADDVAQDVSVEAVQALRGTDFTHREPFAWLCQIAKLRVIDAHRRHFGAEKRNAGREVPLGTPGADSEHAAIIDLLAASMTTPTQALSRESREARLLAALATLPEDQREALRLRYVEGLPSKEIAKRLGKTDGSVRVMLTRSLSRLQQLLPTDESSR